jgi:hypothetical protein
MKQQRVTLYFRGEVFGNIQKMEASAFAVATGPYAQYSDAVSVVFMKKRERTPRGFTQSYRPSLLILGGWNHPDPAPMFGRPEPSSSPDITVQRSAYSCCDEGWQRDFNALIGAHIKATGARVLHDFREHNPYGRAAAEGQG